MISPFWLRSGPQNFTEVKNALTKKIKNKIHILAADLFQQYGQLFIFYNYSIKHTTEEC